MLINEFNKYYRIENKILHNSLYAGYVEWGGIVKQGDHCAIIDRETYESINGAITPVY